MEESISRHRRAVNDADSDCLTNFPRKEGFFRLHPFPPPPSRGQALGLFPVSFLKTLLKCSTLG
jgi:hypothetical protein